MHLHQMGGAGVEGLQHHLPLTHATVHPLRAIEGVFTSYLQLCALHPLPPAYPSVSLGTFRGSSTDEYFMNPYSYQLVRKPNQIFQSIRNEEVTKTLSRNLPYEL